MPEIINVIDLSQHTKPETPEEKLYPDESDSDKEVEKEKKTEMEDEVKEDEKEDEMEEDKEEEDKMPDEKEQRKRLEEEARMAKEELELKRLNEIAKRAAEELEKQLKEEEESNAAAEEEKKKKEAIQAAKDAEEKRKREEKEKKQREDDEKKKNEEIRKADLAEFIQTRFQEWGYMDDRTHDEWIISQKRKRTSVKTITESKRQRAIYKKKIEKEFDCMSKAVVTCLQYEMNRKQFMASISYLKGDENVEEEMEVESEWIEETYGKSVKQKIIQEGKKNNVVRVGNKLPPASFYVHTQPIIALSYRKRDRESVSIGNERGGKF